MVVLGNLRVSLFEAPGSESGSCRATETAEGERDRTAICSLAPDDKPESLMGCERSRVLLLLFLVAKARQHDFDQSRSGTPYLSPCREASKPNFVHASCKTSARCLAGAVLMIARRADESRTTTWEAI